MDLTAYGITSTPLVELRRISPRGVTLLAKCEWHLPTGSVKDRVAAAMVDRARQEGRVGPGDRLCEPSSGNTGIALARVARLAGFPLTVVVPDDVSPERIDLLRAWDAEVRFSPGVEGSNGAVARAEQLAEAEGMVMLHQYENPANPDVHTETTAVEIVDALDRQGITRLDAFVASLGTGGTLTGVARGLRSRFPDARIVAAEPPAGETIAGLRSLDDGYVPPVLDTSLLHRKLLVRNRPALAATRRLLTEEGLFCGPSSGAAVHAALRVAETLDPGSVVVTLLPDAGWKYLSTGIYAGDLDRAAEKVEGATLW